MKNIIGILLLLFSTALVAETKPDELPPKKKEEVKMKTKISVSGKDFEGTFGCAFCPVPGDGDGGNGGDFPDDDEIYPDDLGPGDVPPPTPPSGPGPIGKPDLPPLPKPDPGKFDPQLNELGRLSLGRRGKADQYRSYIDNYRGSSKDLQKSLQEILEQQKKELDRVAIELDSWNKSKIDRPSFDRRIDRLTQEANRKRLEIATGVEVSEFTFGDLEDEVPATYPEALKIEQGENYLEGAREYIEDVFEDDSTLPVRRSLLGGASAALNVAKEAFREGNLIDGDFAYSAGIALIDTAISLAPGVSWVKDIAEAVTGYNVVTGEKLSDLERATAIIGSVTLGIGSKFGKGIQVVDKGIDLVTKITKGSDAVIDSAKAASKAKEIAKSAKNIRGKMSNLGEAIPGTTIPKYFRLKTDGAEFFVNPNATKHMGEYINSLPTSHGSPLRNDLILASFESGVQDAVKSGAWKTSLDTSNPIVSGGWELIFSKRPSDELVVIKHALMKK